MSQQAVSSARYSGVFYAEDTVQFSIQTGATRYTVQDIHGAVVSSGSVSGSSSTLTPQAPEAGWPNGWYLLQLSGGSGYYAIFPFSIINDASGFTSLPAWGANCRGADPMFDSHDLIGIATAAMGTYRWQIPNAGSLSDVTSAVTAIQSDLDFIESWLSTDPARPFTALCQFPNGGVDSCQLGNLVLCRNGANTNPATVTIAAGSLDGTLKLTVTDTSQNRVVETFDNVYAETDLQAAINAGSRWLTCGGASDRGVNLPAEGSQTLPNANTLGVIAAVQALWGYNSAGITCFEGPSNEPGASESVAAGWAAFQATVHAANAKALAIGPSVVEVTQLVQLAKYAKGIGFTPDGVSFHGYSSTFDELVTLDWTYKALTQALAIGGWESLPLYMTEYGDFWGEYGTVMPTHNARAAILFFAFLESIGVPKEQTYWFYPASHGFGGFSSWWRNGDGTYAPLWTAVRNMSERLRGRTFATRLALPDPISRILLAQTWTDSHSQVMLLLPNGPTQLDVSVGIGDADPDDLTVWDWAGNVLSATATDGSLQLSPDMTGVWIQAPRGAILSVDDVNAGLLGSVGANYADPAYGASILGISTDVMADAMNLQNIFGPDPLVGTNASAAPWQDSTDTLPYTITIELPTVRYIARMLILGTSARTDTPTDGVPARDALLGFSIDYLPPGDDAQWTNCYSYDPPVAAAAASSPLSGTWTNMGSNAAWSQLSFYDRTFCFDCVFSAVAEATAVRLTVTQVSTGNAPDGAQASADTVSVTRRLMLRYLGLYPAPDTSPSTATAPASSPSS